MTMTLESGLVATVSVLCTVVTVMAGVVVYLYRRQEKQTEETRRELAACRRDREKMQKQISALVRCLERHSPQQRCSILSNEMSQIDEEFQEEESA